MKTLISAALALTVLAAACSPEQDSPIVQEYKSLLARHDSSHHMHGDVDRRQDDLVGYHTQLKDFINAEEEPDSSLLRVMAQHDAFFAAHDSIMTSHAAIMQQHEAFKARYDAGEVDEDELATMVQRMEAEHDQMDADHTYVVTETRKLRSEHNTLRKQYNELLIQKGK